MHRPGLTVFTIVSMVVPGVCALAGLAGCERAAPTQPPEVFVAGMSALAAEHDPLPLWNALPERFHGDADELRDLLAADIDPQAWERSFAALGRLAAALRTKRDLILASRLREHPLLAASGLSDAEIAEAWENLAAAAESIAASDARTAEGLRRLDIGAFLGGPGTTAIRSFSAVAERVMGDEVRQAARALASCRARVIKEEPERILVAIESPGSEPQEEFFVPIDGRWIQQSFAESWRSTVATARRRLEERRDGTPAPDLFEEVAAAIEEAATGLEAATTPTEAEGALRGLLALAGL